MSPARAAGERNLEVRKAARAWRRAGAIDGPTLERIDAAHPDDGPAVSIAWKVLVFVIVTVAINAAFGFFVVVTNSGDRTGGWLLFAAILAAAAEALSRTPRVGDNGSAAAASFWAMVYAVAGIAFSLDRGHAGAETVITASLLAAAVLFGVACWRWGFAAYGIFSALALFLLLARFSGGRAAWFLFGAVLLAVAPRLQDRAALAPSHRGAAGGVFIVAAAALYASVNRYSLDEHLVESMREHGTTPSAPSPALAALSALATAALPVLLIAWGLRSRRTLALDAGLVAAALSLVTLRYYVHLAPLWILLSGAGAALILAALGLNRWLRGAPAQERGGFTARPLFTPSRSALETVAVVAAFAPDAAPAQPREPGGFTPGGGRYGGGGAGGEF